MSSLYKRASPRLYSDYLPVCSMHHDHHNSLTDFWISHTITFAAICSSLDMAALTHEQLLGIEVSTRFSSIASVLGSLFVVGTFLCFPYFRKSTARLIFYAAWGNIITNASTLISISALPDGSAKVTPLCELQAFLIQWFMLADPSWVGTVHDWKPHIANFAGVLCGLERLVHLHLQV